jgi:hypothetical protein
MTGMDEERAGQDWRQSGVEAFRRLLAAHPPLDSKRPPTADADQVAEKANSPVQRPLVPLFEPDQPDPASAIASPRPAGTPQLVGGSPTPQRRRPAWLLLALVLTVALGLSGAGFFLGSTWTARTLPKPQAAPAPLTQPTSVTATSIVVRQVATPACLEAATRGDQLITLLINNQRSRAAKLLVPYHVASRQCARDAGP